MNQHGITLIELLASLAIMGIISVAIISYLINGMYNFQHVNSQISLQDEANIILEEFERHIFAAKKVEETESSCQASINCSLITVTKVNFESNTEEYITLGFKDNQAVVDLDASEQTQFTVLHSSGLDVDGSKIMLDASNADRVLIRLMLENSESETKQKFELEKKVPYIKVS